MKNEIDVSYVAKLAKLELDGNTSAKLQKDMENIVHYVKQLEELDLSEIEPTAYVEQAYNVWREDEVTQSFPRENMLKNAPELVDDELIKVPQVISGDEEI